MLAWAWLLKKVQDAVPDTFVKDQTANIEKLRDSLATGEINFELAVKLLGSIHGKVRHAAERTSQRVVGRLGCITGPTAEQDIRRAVVLLDALMVQFFCVACGCTPPKDGVAFGLAALADDSKLIDDAMMVSVFKDLFSVAAISARNARRSVDSPRLDWNAEIALVIEQSLATRISRDDTAVEARAATKAFLIEMGSPLKAPKESGPAAPGAAKSKRSEKREAQRDRAAKRAAAADGGLEEPSLQRPKGEGKAKETLQLGWNGDDDKKAARDKAKKDMEKAMTSLKPDSLKANSIKKVFIKDERGLGLVDVCSRVCQHASDLEFSSLKLACPWLGCFGKCIQGAKNECKRCEGGGKVDASTLKALWAACTPELKKELKDKDDKAPICAASA